MKKRNIRRFEITKYIKGVLTIKSKNKMKKITIKLTSLLLFTIMITTTNKSHSQACNQWTRTVPGNLKLNLTVSNSSGSGDMVVDASDNIYITGFDTYFLSKYDNTGNLVWNKTKSGLRASDVVMTTTGELFVTATDALLCKYDGAGNELFPPITVANTSPTSMCIDNNNNVYIIGQISGSAVFGANTYSSGRFVVKYNSAGVLVWSKNVTAGFQNTYCAIITDGSFVYISGNGNNSIVSVGAFSSASSIMGNYIIKFDMNGNPIWVKPVYMQVTSSTDILDMAFDSNHNILFTGYFSSGIGVMEKIDTSGLNEMSIGPTLGYGVGLKTDNNGKFYHVGKTPNSTYSNEDESISIGDANTSTGFSFVNHYSCSSNSDLTYFLIGLSPSGNMYLAFEPLGTAYLDMNTVTNTSGNIVIVKFNQSKRYLPDFSPQAISCGDSVLLGQDISTYPAMVQAYNFTTNNTFLWTPVSGLSSSTIVNPKAAPTTNTNYTVTVNGGCTETVNLTVSNSSSFSYSTNNMVATFTQNGIGCNSFLWDFGNGNTSSINANPVVTYSSPGTYSVCLQCNGQSSQCVQCLNITVPSIVSGGIGINETADNNSIVTISPNPFTEQTVISFSEDQQNTTIKIMDVVGKEIKTVVFSGKSLVIEKGEMRAGVYFVEISGGSAGSPTVVNRKIVIQ